MNNDILIEMIRQAGFSEYEAKCYLALLERDSLAVNEVARLSGIPRPSAYDVLEKLLDKGLVAVIPGKTKRYAASDPRLLREKSLNSLKMELESLERKKKDILAREKAVQNNMGTIIDRLGSLYKASRVNGNPLEYIEVLKDPDQIHRRAIQLCSETTKEMIAFVKPPFAYLSDEQKEEQIEIQAKAIQRGVKIKNIHEMPVDEIGKNLLFERLRKGADVESNEDRIIEKLPMKMVIFDGKTAMHTLEDPIQGQPSLTTLVTEHSALAESLKMTFELCWEKAKDYYILDNQKYFLSKSGRKEDKRDPKQKN
jgi:HTH-type transcriptional regulator, sugar sensing transcriptional regulator